jgi:type II secretory pathway pseudopilin PulG
MKKTQKFTMVELLVVIGVIAILVSLLLPAVMKGKERALIIRARADVTSIAVAIGQFETTYGYLPLDPGTGSEAQLSSTEYTELIEELTVQSTTYNTRGIPFLSINGTTLKDPWGEDYNVKLDYDYDNSVIALGDTIFGKSAVWSEGDPDDPDASPITNWD